MVLIGGSGKEHPFPGTGWALLFSSMDLQQAQAAITGLLHARSVTAHPAEQRARMLLQCIC